MIFFAGNLFLYLVFFFYLFPLVCRNIKVIEKDTRLQRAKEIKYLKECIENSQDGMLGETTRIRDFTGQWVRMNVRVVGLASILVVAELRKASQIF